MTKSFIFLDVDGVLNDINHLDDLVYLEELKKLVTHTNSKIVLSSSWSSFFHQVGEFDKPIPISKSGFCLEKALNSVNLEISHILKYSYHLTRPQAIEYFINYHQPSRSIILDDEYHLEYKELSTRHQSIYVVETSYDKKPYGLTVDKVDKLINKLLNENEELS